MKAFTLLVFGMMAMMVSFVRLPDSARDGTDQGRVNDFRSRCQSKGVVRCFGFDSPDEVVPFLTPAADGRIHAVVDSDVKASGAGSLRFDILPETGANSSGAFSLSFAREFGSGDELYIQWRQRFDREILTHAYLHGAGWKQAIVSEGGRPLKSARSCTANEVVIQNNYYRGFPQMYHSCGAKDSQFQPLNPFVPPADYLLEDAVGCRYSNQAGKQCFRYLPGQWMTFQMHIRVGKWYVNESKNYHRDSTVELWVAEENKPSMLVISIPDYDLVHDSVDQKFGRIWLLPYNTDKDPSERHPIAHTWYDELILSRTRIPDPDVAAPSPPDSLLAKATANGTELQWRNNGETETGFQIERCAGAIYDCEGSQAFMQIGLAGAKAAGFKDERAGTRTRYTYRVRAINKAGASAYSNPATNVPKPPSDLTAAVSGTTAKLSWLDNSNSSDETAFVIEGCSGENCTNFKETGRVSANQAEYALPGPMPAGVYRYRVKSINSVGSWLTWDRADDATTNIVSVAIR